MGKNHKPVRLTDQESIPEVIKEMTLLEKAQMVAGILPFQTFSIERLGIPSIILADGHNGINIRHLIENFVPGVLKSFGKGMVSKSDVSRWLSSFSMENLRELLTGKFDESVFGELPYEKREVFKRIVEKAREELPGGSLPSCFPPGIVMGATWNPELVGECANAVAKEAKAFYVDILLGPNVNIHRDPLCGRIFESYSEDPFLTSQIVIEYVKGVQSEGVAADVKHFLANNQEFKRRGIDEKISERALREIYLPAFKAAIHKGDCWTVMSAYNKVNGEACSSNKRILTDILRNEWDFSGFVVSDWGGVYNRISSIKAGNDLEMPGPNNPQEIIEAVQKHELEEIVLDERISNILNILIRVPAFKGKQKSTLDRVLSSGITRKVATEGMVLLKNDNAALPLIGKNIRLAVMGENAKKPIATGLGSAGIIGPHTVSLLEGLRSMYGEEAISFGEITDNADAVIIAVGVISGEGRDRETLALTETDMVIITQTLKECRKKGKKIIVVLNVCGPVEMYEWINDVDAVLLIWLPGMELGNAVADILSGNVNPSGKLPLTFPKRYKDAPTSLNFPGEFGEVVYGEGIYVGYRYYDYSDVDPQFPFGHGLSYTDFEFSNLKLSSSALNIDKDEVLRVSVDVTNIGKREGKEVVQLYIHDLISIPHKPVKELKGFKKVNLKPGETKAVEILITKDHMSHYDPQKKEWCIEPGIYEVLVGKSSRDLCLQAELKVLGVNPYGYGAETTIAEIMSNEKAVAILRKHLPHNIVSSKSIQLELRLSPESPFDKVWNEKIARELGKLSDTEKEKIIKSIYEDLAKIEVRRSK